MEIIVVALALTVGLLTLFLVFMWRARQKGLPGISDAVKAEFQNLSQQALNQASETFLNLANERFSRQTEAGVQELETKKQLIDQQLSGVKGELEKVSNLVQSFEKDRAAKFGELTTQLKAITEQTAALTTSTSTLREALSSSRVRGQWGERMAEDILRLIGFAEGINYMKQSTIQDVGTRPDFVFLLPGDLRMNMDVKFPLDNYVRYLEGDSDQERDQRKTDFVRDVRAHIKEVSTRDYIDPAGGTVDYVLLFIPNESIYSFIHENDPDIVEVALKARVICCSPMTLFAVLSMVRQAVDSFALQKASEEIISLFGSFNAQWSKFGESLDTLGRRITSVQNAYEQVAGPRKRMLERPLNRIEGLRVQRGIEAAPVIDVDIEASEDEGLEIDPQGVSDS